MLTFGWAILNRWLKSLKLTVFQFFLLFCCQASFAVSQQPIYNTTTAFFRQLFLQSFFDFFWKFFQTIFGRRNIFIYSNIIRDNNTLYIRTHACACNISTDDKRRCLLRQCNFAQYFWFRLFCRKQPHIRNDGFCRATPRHPDTID